MSNRLASINIYTPRVAIVNTVTVIPYSKALRIKRICLERENLSLRTNQLKYHLSKWEYSDQFLISEINSAINTSHGSSSLLSNRLNSNRVALVVPKLPKLERAIRHYQHIVHDSYRFQQAFPSLPIIAFHQPSNLPDVLVLANITPKTSDPLATFAAKLEGVRPAPYWSPQTHSPAVWLENDLY